MFAYAANLKSAASAESASKSESVADTEPSEENEIDEGVLDALSHDYSKAVEAYETALDRQATNAERIAALEVKVGEAEKRLETAKQRLEELSVEMYKNMVEPGELLDAILSCSSLSDSIVMYEDYTRLEAARKKQCEDARLTCENLSDRLSALERKRESLEEDVSATRQAVAEAKDALRKAAHLNGAKYHQVQRNGVNCGATAFIVGVNIMLGKNRFKDNLEVWESEAFGRDSTVSLAEKGMAWLKDNKLDGKLRFEYVKGDIFTADALREQLEAGNVVVISSGSGSEWQRVDEAEPQKGLYPAGHWIVFYGYREGVFYANDSAVSAKKGAGCPYTEKQMQQWLDGRSYHFACALSLVPQADDDEADDEAGEANKDVKAGKTAENK